MTPEEKIRQIAEQWLAESDYNVARDAATEMYEWTKERVIKEACEWFEQYLFDIGYPDDWLRDSQYQKSGKDRFKKTMEECL